MIDRVRERRIVAGVLLALVFGLMVGMLIAEYKLQRFGGMVCREKYGMHYEFRGFRDNGDSMSYRCAGLWGDDEPLDALT